MELSWRKGLSFGAASGVITTLGLMIGLQSSTNLRSAVIGGILVIAIADAMSDSLGMHISEESEGVHSHKEIWLATVATFITKFVIACSFIFPVLLFSLNLAILVSIFWGILLIVALNIFIAREQKMSPWGIIGEHLLIAIIVIILTHYAGELIGIVFKM